jgi:hypothetical protein
MKSATLDRSAAEAAARIVPPPAQPPEAVSLKPREVRKVAETIETGDYRAILCCSIEKTSD